MNRTLQLQQDKAALIQAAQSIVTLAGTEKRGLTPEERATVTAKTTEAEGIDETLKLEARLAAASNIPNDRAPGQVHDNAVDKPWKNFGEFMQAVHHAGDKNGDRSVDPRLHKRAASGLSEAVPSDGGFLIQPDYASELIKRTYETGVLISRVKKLPISEGTNEMIINGIDETSRANGSRWGGVRAYWANEADALTGSKPKFRQLRLQLKKLTGLCYATDEVLKDAATLGAVIMEGFSEEFGFVVDDAIVRGVGSDRPLGFLNSNALVTVAKESGQAAQTIVPQNIVNMRKRLWARSRANSVWLVNQDVHSQLDLMTLPIGTGGVSVYLPANGLSGLPYDTLYGRPVIDIEQASTLGALGDVMLVDLSQYLLIDRDMEAAQSIHVRFLFDENTFRFIYRVDGQSAWHQPLTPANGTTTQSPFIALAAR